MHRECRERFSRHRLRRKPLVGDLGMLHGTCVTHVPWCMSGLLSHGKRSWHSRRMRNPQFYVYGKRPMFWRYHIYLDVDACASSTSCDTCDGAQGFLNCSCAFHSMDDICDEGKQYILKFSFTMLIFTSFQYAWYAGCRRCASEIHPHHQDDLTVRINNQYTVLFRR